MNNKLNLFPEFNPDEPVYFIDKFNKISIGNIIGFQAESIVVDKDRTVLKIGQGFFQIKKLHKSVTFIETVSTEKVFKELKDAVKKISDSDEIFSKIQKEFQKDSIIKPELHNENHYNPVDTFDEYQRVAMSTKAYGKGLPVFYPALKLNGEAGEVAEKIGKIWRDKEGYVSHDDKKEIEKELSDCLWYICAIADDLSINLVQIANTNIYKILDRRKRGVISGNGDNR